MTDPDVRNVRMVMLTDWDTGFQIAPKTLPLELVPPGGEYIVECPTQEDVVLTSINVRDFVLERLYVDNRFVEVVPDVTESSSDRAYHPEHRAQVKQRMNVRAVLKNMSGEPQKPKIAMLLYEGQSITAARKQWRIEDVQIKRAVRPLAPSCPVCGSPDRDTRRQIGMGDTFCRDGWHSAHAGHTGQAKDAAVHAPHLGRTLHDGPGNATYVRGCSCGAPIETTRDFADHVGLPARAVDAMLGLVGIVYDLCDMPKDVTREEVARRVARCLEFAQP